MTDDQGAPRWIGEGKNTLQVHSHDLRDILDILPPETEMRVQSILRTATQGTAQPHELILLNRGDRPLQVNDGDLSAITTALAARLGKVAQMSDQTDDAIAARERTRERLESNRPEGLPSSPAYAEVTARRQLWDALTALVKLGTASLKVMMEQVEREEAQRRGR